MKELMTDITIRDYNMVWSTTLPATGQSRRLLRCFGICAEVDKATSPAPKGPQFLNALSKSLVNSFAAFKSSDAVQRPPVIKKYTNLISVSC